MYRRRAFIGSLLSPALAPLIFGASDANVATLTPEEEEGPFYIAGEHVRRAIAEGRPGVPLDVRIRVLDVRTRAPIAGAAVDVWHCDALGVYSGFDAMQPPPDLGAGGPGPGGPAHARQTNALTFLRGVQVTDVLGMVRFSTIFPGFYEGRTNHIHLKVHLDTSPSNRTGRIVHTGQMFFPETLARAISAQAPYANHHIERTTQQDDHVFTEQHGAATIARIDRSSHPAGGYVASLTVVVRTAAA